jgi:hypothetical protein
LRSMDKKWMADASASIVHKRRRGPRVLLGLRVLPVLPVMAVLPEVRDPRAELAGHRDPSTVHRAVPVRARALAALLVVLLPARVPVVIEVAAEAVVATATTSSASPKRPDEVAVKAVAVVVAAVVKAAAATSTITSTSLGRAFRRPPPLRGAPSSQALRACSLRLRSLIRRPPPSSFARLADSPSGAGRFTPARPGFGS